MGDDAVAPIFLDFDKFDQGTGEQLDHGLERIGDAFADLGGGFVKLVDAATDEFKFTAASDDNLSLVFKHEEQVVGHDFIKVGFDFLKVDVPLHKFDDMIVKFSDEFFKVIPSASDESFSLADDLLKYETDFKVIGADFLKAGVDLKGDAPSETLSLDFNSLQIDYKMQSADAQTLGEDFLKLGAVAGDLKLDDLSEAFIKYGQDYVNLAAVDLKVASDFGNVSQDLAPSTDASASFTLDRTIAQHPEDFLGLVADFHKLNTDFAGLGADAHKIAEGIEASQHLLVFKAPG